MSDPVSLVIALLLGFVLQQAAMCTVANVERLVLRRQPSGMAGLAIAVSWSGVVLLGLAALHPGDVRLPGEQPVTIALVIGAVMAGVGATINGGCFVGSVARIGAGDLNFLASIIGIGIGMRWMDTSGQGIASMGTGWSATPGAMLAWLAFAAVGLAAILMAIHRGEHRTDRWRTRWPRAFALSAAGLLAGLMFARNPNWTYTVAVDAIAHAGDRPVPWTALASSLALFSGAVIGAWMAGRFKTRFISSGRSMRCLTGGLLMGAGARMIPGGNDTLLLWSIPGLTAYGVVAYALMTLTIAATLYAMHR